MLTPNQFRNRSIASDSTEESESITRAREIIRKIESALAGSADPSVKSYQINNRRIDRYSVSELISLLDYFKKQVATANGKRCNVYFGL